jgi:hypothetical protein
MKVADAVGVLGKAPDSQPARYPAEAMGLVRGSAVVELFTRGARTGAERRISITAHELGDGLSWLAATGGVKDSRPGSTTSEPMPRLRY